MKLYIEPIYDKKMNVLDQPSAYNPSAEVRECLAAIKHDYAEAQYIRDSTYEEFNDRDLVQQLNDDMRAFNSYIPAPSDDPNEEWRANVVKPVTRAKAISIAANVTAAVLYPNIIAQNKNSEMDRDAAMVMKDLVEFSLDESQYEKTFVRAVIAAMYSPAVFIEDGFAEVYRLLEEGGSEEVLDEVFSGFQNHLIACDDMFIGNIYEPELQKQPFLIKRKVIDYSEAKIKYGDLEDFKYVQPGLRVFYEDDQDSFYERYEESMRTRLVEEVTYYNRLSNLELVLVNGILVHGDTKRPMQRKDGKYPFTHFGFEPYNERFFYRKSLVAKIAPEQSIIDVLYGLAIDSAMLQTMPPGITFGNESVDSAIVVPGKVTTMQTGSEYQSLQSGVNMDFALKMLQAMEGSVEQNSASSLLGGATPQGASTAFEVATIQENAMKVLGLFGKMVKFMVEDFGNLRIGSILQFMTVAEGLEVTGETSRLRFRDVLIPDRMVDGKKMPRKVEFKKQSFKSEEEVKRRSYELLSKEKALEMSLAEVNPTLFRNLKYKSKVEADMLFSQSETVRKALNLEAYDRAIANPVIQNDPAALKEVTREFLFSNYVPGDEDKYLPEDQANPIMAMAGQAGGDTGIIQKALGRQADPRAL